MSACSPWSIPRPAAAADVDTHRRGVRKRFAEAAESSADDIAAAWPPLAPTTSVVRTDRDWVVDLVRFVGSRKARPAGRSGPALMLRRPPASPVTPGAPHHG